MLVSLNWVKKFANLPADLENSDLIAKIGAQVAEVESVVDLSQKYAGVLVAEIIEAAEHPDADKLGVYQVNIGSKTVQVVAGDKTLTAGDKTAYVSPGAIVPSTFGTEEPFIIENRALRGVDSEGMMAAAKELGWGDDYSRVLKLDTDKPAGTTLIEAYELDDLIIEIENKTLTHRPDCFGLLGFARELAGVNKVQFKTPEWFSNAIDSQSVQGSLPLSVELQADACNRYVGFVMDNVEIKPSPLLLQTYLLRVGIRPINNIVDITNYMMVETGQPMHAFDYDKVAELSGDGVKLYVRFPEAGEKLVLLDGREIEPHKEALIITTDKVLIDLAGAMGGANTDISDTTKRIIIESANFDMYNLRRTSMNHGIFTEAVTRFIRGQSPEQCLAVALKAAEMATQLSGATFASQLVDVYPNAQEEVEIKTSLDFINSRLGANNSADLVANTLNNVELETSVTGDELKVKVPFWRKDLHIDEDMVEEVGRLIGYDALKPSLPARDLTPARLDSLQKLIMSIRDAMVKAGANEVLTYNFMAESDLKKAGQNPDKAFKLRNSISPQLQVMRTAILPSLLGKVHPNIKLGYDQFALFEINKSHRKDNMDGDLPVEEYSVASVFAAEAKVKSEETHGSAYYQAKYFVDYLLKRLNIKADFVQLTDNDGDWVGARIGSYNKPRTSLVVAEGKVLGLVGEICPNAHKNYKLPDYSAGFEIDLAALLSVATGKDSYIKQIKYPGTSKDITMEFGEEVKTSDILKTIETELAKLEGMENSCQAVDSYKAEGASTVNLTFRLELRHREHTLTTEEANKITNDVVSVLSSEFSAKQV